MKEEKKKQSTELATTETKPTAAPSPFGFKPKTFEVFEESFHVGREPADTPHCAT